jgi:hypothetical protein
MLSLTVILLVAALVVTLLAAIGKAPLWVGVLLTIMAALLASGWPR